MENKILARVEGKEVTERDIDNAISRLPRERQAAFNTPEGRKQLLEQIIAFELFYRYGKDNNMDQTQKFVDSLEIAKRQILTEIAIENVISEAKVIDDEAEDYYKANEAMFTRGETIEARHILVDSEELANEVIKEIKGGMPFAEAATKYSSCPSKAEGGNLGRFGKGQMVPEFEEAAFKLEPGKISDPVKTQFGYHIIEVQSKQEAQVEPFSKVKDMIKSRLLQERQNFKYLSSLDELKKRYSVEME